MTERTYTTTNPVRAEPMTRGEYNDLRGREVPADENPADEGYLVECLDGSTPNVPGRAGYVSWRPKAQFEAAYRPTTGLPFGLAIEAMRMGKRVARAGWNGRGMWLLMVPGTPSAQLREGSPYREATGLEQCDILPHIDMWTVDASGRRAMLPGWLASQSDMLADDWYIVEGE